MNFQRKYIKYLFIGAFLLALFLKQDAAQNVAANQKAIVTLSFDDAPLTLYENGFSITKKYHVPATLYVIAQFVENDEWYFNWQQIGEVKDAGWEIGNHTYTHENLTELDVNDVQEELDWAQQLLSEHGYKVTAFSSPFGKFNDQTLELVKSRFTSNREAIQDNKKGMTNLNDIDPYRIPAFELQNDVSFEKAKLIIDEAVANKNWLNIFLHSVVSGKPEPYEYNVGELEKVIAYLSKLRAQNKIEIMNMSEVVDKYVKKNKVFSLKLL